MSWPLGGVCFLVDSPRRPAQPGPCPAAPALCVWGGASLRTVHRPAASAQVGKHREVLEMHIPEPSLHLADPLWFLQALPVILTASLQKHWAEAGVTQRNKLVHLQRMPQVEADGEQISIECTFYFLKRTICLEVSVFLIYCEIMVPGNLS